MLYQSEAGSFKIALAGDCVPTRRLSVFREDRFLKLRDIFCEADVGFAHLESTVHNFLKGSLNLSEGTYITTEPFQWQQMRALCQYRGGKLNEINLVPLDLGFGKPRTQRGRPLLADEQLGEKIISRVATLSKRYGTEVSFSNGRGVAKIG
jgi:hypothetical protein